MDQPRRLRGLAAAAACMLAISLPFVAFGHLDPEIDDGAVEIAAASAGRALDAAQLARIAHEPIAAFTYLRMRMQSVARGQLAANCDELPQAEVGNRLILAMNEWLSFRCDSDARGDGKLFQNHGRYAYWATLVAFDGQPQAFFVEALRREGSRVEFLSDDAHRLLRRSARRFDGVEEAVTFWLSVCVGLDAQSSVIGLVELGEPGVRELEKRHGQPSAKGGASDRNDCVVPALKASGIYYNLDLLDLNAEERRQIDLRRATTLGKPGRRDWRLSLANHVLFRSGSTLGVPPHINREGR